MRYPELAKELKRRIDRLGLETGKSVEEIAFEAGIERRTMYDIMNAEHNMQDHTLVKLGAYLKMTFAELLPFVDDKYDRQKPRPSKAKVIEPPRRARKKGVKVVRRRRI